MYNYGLYSLQNSSNPSNSYVNLTERIKKPLILNVISLIVSYLKRHFVAFRILFAGFLFYAHIPSIIRIPVR